jgi:hypothetical protein
MGISDPSDRDKIIVTTFPCTLEFPCVLAYGFSFDSSTLVKTSAESEFKSDKPGKRILVSPADKLDLPD